MEDDMRPSKTSSRDQNDVSSESMPSAYVLTLLYSIFYTTNPQLRVGICRGPEINLLSDAQLISSDVQVHALEWIQC